MNSRYYNYFRAEIVASVTGKNKLILDVGCGGGNFASMLIAEGHEVWGVEPNESAFEQAQEKCSKTFNCTFADFNVEQRFDYIVFNDVLEHMPDPWSALTKAKNLLAKDGKVIASIPNFFYYWEFRNLLVSRDFKYNSSGIFDKTHLRFFTKKSMIDMFNQSEYEIDRIEGLRAANSRFLKLLNTVFLDYFDEFKYMQYLVIAKPKTNE